MRSSYWLRVAMPSRSQLNHSRLFSYHHNPLFRPLIVELYKLPGYRALIGCRIRLGPDSPLLQKQRQESIRTIKTYGYYQINSRINTTSMASLKRPISPVQRPSSPYQNPRVAGPRSQQLKQSTSNFHSTSLRKMVSNTVNKTSLHPGGVQ
jgi:hypothetical protein